ncbi:MULTISPECIES: DUF4403 family protein [Pontibacter]|uniref:DUF4403 family protein n=1 Tax=Pontibacter lucknowensis TaxID=1077936 RepID=A0A1N6YIY6_9BACT|nr:MULTISPECIES: DUF4403 family protein [Pontibacter]EJF11065.1 hypothetical protein O71_05384 [Pontibacter sp. BAB1700]SIR14587.1 protein of unknown function [Pontibacter lucknowensis]
MENFVKIQVPVTISYPALESVLQKQLVGEYIPKPSEDADANPYAQILDVGLAGSSAGAGDIILKVRIRVLRTILKRDNVDLYVQATPGYDNDRQQVYIRRFNMQAQTSSRFYNSSLEVLVNKVAYNQIIQKARVNLSEIIAGELTKANGMLEAGMDLKGLKLTGAVEEVRVQDITPKSNRLFLNLELQAKVEVDVFDLSELLPA